MTERPGPGSEHGLPRRGVERQPPIPDEAALSSQPEAEATGVEQRERLPETRLGTYSEAAEQHPDRNEDTILDASDHGLVGVLDGMGGYAGGERASRIVAAEAENSWRGLAGEGSVEDRLGQAVRAGYDALQRDDELLISKAGTTLTLMALDKAPDGTTDAVIANVGDSRAYRWHNGELQQITLDDVYALEGIEENQAHTIQASLSNATNQEEADRAGYPGYFDSRAVLSRAVAAGREFPEPKITRTRLEEGDGVFLMSDGVTDNLTNTEITQIAREATNAQEFSQTLVARARERSQDGDHIRSKDDDITALAYWHERDPEPMPPTEAPVVQSAHEGPAGVDDTPTQELRPRVEGVPDILTRRDLGANNERHFEERGLGADDAVARAREAVERAAAAEAAATAAGDGQEALHLRRRTELLQDTLRRTAQQRDEAPPQSRPPEGSVGEDETAILPRGATLDELFGEPGGPGGGGGHGGHEGGGGHHGGHGGEHGGGHGLEGHGHGEAGEEALEEIYGRVSTRVRRALEAVAARPNEHHMVSFGDELAPRDAVEMLEMVRERYHAEEEPLHTYEYNVDRPMPPTMRGLGWAREAVRATLRSGPGVRNLKRRLSDDRHRKYTDDVYALVDPHLALVERHGVDGEFMGARLIVMAEPFQQVEDEGIVARVPSPTLDQVVASLRFASTPSHQRPRAEIPETHVHPPAEIRGVPASERGPDPRSVTSPPVWERDGRDSRSPDPADYAAGWFEPGTIPARGEGAMSGEEYIQRYLPEDPERILELLSYADIKDGDEKTEAMQEVAARPELRKFIYALDGIIKEHGEPALMAQVETLQNEVANTLDGGIVKFRPSKDFESDSWAVWDITRQVYFAHHPEESSLPKEQLADPFGSSSDEAVKLVRQGMVNHRVGWELDVAARTGRLDPAVLSPEVREVLEHGARASNGILTSEELVRLGGQWSGEVTVHQRALEAERQEQEQVKKLGEEADKAAKHEADMTAYVTRLDETWVEALSLEDPVERERDVREVILAEAQQRGLVRVAPDKGKPTDLVFMGMEAATDEGRGLLRALEAAQGAWAQAKDQKQDKGDKKDNKPKEQAPAKDPEQWKRIRPSEYIEVERARREAHRALGNEKVVRLEKEFNDRIRKVAPSTEDPADRVRAYEGILHDMRQEKFAIPVTIEGERDTWGILDDQSVATVDRVYRLMERAQEATKQQSGEHETKPEKAIDYAELLKDEMANEEATGTERSVALRNIIEAAIKNGDVHDAGADEFMDKGEQTDASGKALPRRRYRYGVVPDTPRGEELVAALQALDPARIERERPVSRGEKLAAGTRAERREAAKELGAEAVGSGETEAATAPGEPAETSAAEPAPVDDEAFSRDLEAEADRLNAKMGDLGAQLQEAFERRRHTFSKRELLRMRRQVDDEMDAIDPQAPPEDRLQAYQQVLEHARDTGFMTTQTLGDEEVIIPIEGKMSETAHNRVKRAMQRARRQIERRNARKDWRGPEREVEVTAKAIEAGRPNTTSQRLARPENPKPQEWNAWVEKIDLEMARRLSNVSELLEGDATRVEVNMALLRANRLAVQTGFARAEENETGTGLAPGLDNQGREIGEAIGYIEAVRELMDELDERDGRSRTRAAAPAPAPAQAEESPSVEDAVLEADEGPVEAEVPAETGIEGDTGAGTVGEVAAESRPESAATNTREQLETLEANQRSGDVDRAELEQRLADLVQAAAERGEIDRDSTLDHIEPLRDDLDLPDADSQALVRSMEVLRRRLERTGSGAEAPATSQPKGRDRGGKGSRGGRGQGRGAQPGRGRQGEGDEEA